MNTIAIMILLMAQVIAADDSESFVHVRMPQLNYRTQKHSSSDEVGQTSPKMVPFFRVKLERDVFRNSSKWNGELDSLPISIRDIRMKMEAEASEIFKSPKEWQLKSIILVSVSESEGAYVWVGNYEEDPDGPYSSLMHLPIYFTMDGIPINPICIKGNEKMFGSIFVELPDK